MSVTLPAPEVTVAGVTAALLSDDMPPSEAVAATPGAAPKARRADARPARLTSSTFNTVGANGLTTVVFTRPFDKRPGVDCLLVESAEAGPYCFTTRRYLKNTAPAGQPVVWAEWTDADAGTAQIGAVELLGYRINGRTPTVNFTLFTVLTFVLTGVNSALQGIVDGLSNKSTYTYIAAGTKFTCIAVASSEP